MDYATNFEQFYIIIEKFDFVAIFHEDLLIQFFLNNLKFWIITQINKRNWEQNFWNKFIKNTIDIEIKAGYQLLLAM